MKKSERNEIIKWTESLSNEELESEYYDAAFEALGSDAEIMYELGYDIRDIKERERHERYLAQRSQLLEEICCKRGIKLWESEIK